MSDMFFIYEQLANDHIRDLENQAAAWRELRARRAGRPRRTPRLLSRVRHVIRHPQPVHGSPVRRLETTTSKT